MLQVDTLQKIVYTIKMHIQADFMLKSDQFTDFTLEHFSLIFGCLVFTVRVVVIVHTLIAHVHVLPGIHVHVATISYMAPGHAQQYT